MSALHLHGLDDRDWQYINDVCMDAGISVSEFIAEAVMDAVTALDGKAKIV